MYLRRIFSISSGLLLILVVSSFVMRPVSTEAFPLVLATPLSPTQVSEIVTNSGNTLSNTWELLPQQMISEVAFRHYATVNRVDGTYRQMFINEQALQAWQVGNPLPEGTFIVMETYYSPNVESTNFTKQLNATDGFHYGSFSPNNPSFEVRQNMSCTQCHQASTDPNGTFTLPMLAQAIETGEVMQTLCNNSGRTPCDADTYLNSTPLQGN
jgi:hypothetical protein